MNDVERRENPYVVESHNQFTVKVGKPYQGTIMECHRVPLSDVFHYEDITYREQVKWFTEHVLISWNVEMIQKETDPETNEEATVQRPVPPTADGLLSLEHPHVIAILGAWYTSVLKPPEDLEIAS